MAGAPPATELRLDLEKMTLRDWSDALLRGCGFTPKPPILDPATDGQLDHRPRAWLAAAALIELGLGGQVEGFLSGKIDFDAKDVEEVQSWLRRIQQTRSRALQERQSAVIVTWGEEQPVSAGWSPSGRFGAISFSAFVDFAVGDFTVQLSLSIRGASKSSGPVWLLEPALDDAQKSALEHWLKLFRPQRVVYLRRDEADWKTLPELGIADIPIIGAESLDDAMEQALRYLSLPA